MNIILFIPIDIVLFLIDMGVFYLIRYYRLESNLKSLDTARSNTLYPLAFI